MTPALLFVVLTVGVFVVLKIFAARFAILQSVGISFATASAVFFLLWFLDAFVRRLLRWCRLVEVSAEYRIADLAGADRAAEKLLLELKDYQEPEGSGIDTRASSNDESVADEGAMETPPIPKESDEGPRTGTGDLPVRIFNAQGASQLVKLVQEQSEGNAGLIIKYYAQGHRQASLSFILSMLAAIAGFVIAAAAVVGYLKNPENVTAAVATAVVSAVIELIGFLFFKRADNGRELMMQMVDRIRQDREQERNYVTTLAMLDRIDSNEIRDMMHVVVIREFSGVAVSLDEMVEFIGSGIFPKTKAQPLAHMRGSNSAPNKSKTPSVDLG
jgi:heme/copper-type cytochrome/quinol oxidase subunit 4